MANDILSAARLRELLHYDPETGAFTYKVNRPGVLAGTVAGSDHSKGYRKHKVDGLYYPAHRLAWLFSYGVWPTYEIDHINGVRNDNRLCNLRDIPSQRNSENQRLPSKNNKAGFLGVCSPCGHDRKYKAMIYVAGKAITLGRFDNPEDAHLCYVQAKRKLHEGCTI